MRQAHLHARIGQPIYTEFGGIPVDANSILVGHAWLGDLDLNGTVDGDDYYRLDRGFLTGATGYANGDLDYSGGIGAKDYFLADLAFLSQAGSGASPESMSASSVPEPAGLAPLACMAVALTLRLRLRRQGLEVL